MYVKYAAIVNPVPNCHADPATNHIHTQHAAPTNPNDNNISRLRPDRSAIAPTTGINTTNTNAENDATYVNNEPGAIGTPNTCTRPLSPTAFAATAGRYRLRNTATTVVSNACDAHPYVYQALRCRRSASPENTASVPRP